MDRELYSLCSTLGFHPATLGGKLPQTLAQCFIPAALFLILEGRAIELDQWCCQSNANPSPAAFGVGVFIQPEAGAIPRGRCFSSI
ncbi:MAG: hypothetical protein HRT80_16515 [Henriciella sp.]|nr:hypothetical protein [Henriciella sp.]